ncbi:MAG: nuclear transport factor 2 family protein [Candidatus Sumerlaeaceae bacterium]|nr:nuclear transport factor 2 family protein [Candidatus Sumerlaeaceae bacterium]
MDAFNRGDLEGICNSFAPDAVVHGVLGWGGLDKVRPIWADLISCFAMKLEVQSIVAEGDTVALRYIERGQSIASFRGGPVTGKSYEVVAMEWFELCNGMITRRWGARDSAAISRQLGLPIS